jgi:hypothetical protein
MLDRHTIWRKRALGVLLAKRGEGNLCCVSEDIFHLIVVIGCICINMAAIGHVKRDGVPGTPSMV